MGGFYLYSELMGILEMEKKTVEKFISDVYISIENNF